ncbi:MAG: hypothetical protein ACXVJB_06380 [Mucilaginibacter sp.]
MKKIISLLIVIIFFASCKPSDTEIMALLKSKDIDDRVKGAYMAGETGESKFIPYLINNADDPAISLEFGYYGYSVYQEKMIALKKILKKDPPVEITRQPDTTVIRFYIRIIKENGK